MKTFPLNFSGELSRSRVLTLAFFAVALTAAYVLAGYILPGDLTTLTFIAMLSAGVTTAIAILRSWRNGVYFFVVWLLFEDFARKFFGNNMAIYFAKDLLLMLVYLAFFAAYRRKDKDLEKLALSPQFAAAPSSGSRWIR